MSCSTLHLPEFETGIDTLCIYSGFQLFFAYFYLDYMTNKLKLEMN